ALFVCCPFYFHQHLQPCDYWRFTPDALKLLLRDYPSKIVGWHGPARHPANVWALAFREHHPPIEPAQYARYRELMARYARIPLPWPRQRRSPAGRLLCGRPPFAPWLARQRWQSQCLGERCPLTPEHDVPTHDLARARRAPAPAKAPARPA